MCTPSYTCFLGPARVHITSQTAYRSVQPFLHSSQQRVPILCNGLPFPPKIAPSHGGDLEPNLKQGSLGPPGVHTTHPKRHLDRFSRFCLAYGLSLYFTMGRPFPHHSCSFAFGEYTLTWISSPSESTTQTVSLSVLRFLQGSRS